MHFDGIGVQAGELRPATSRAALAVSVFVALTFGLSGHALAQCAGSYPSSSGTGVHGTPSASAGVHTTTSTASTHTGSSCGTGGTAKTISPHLNSANLGSGAGKPALSEGRHWHSTEHENSHSVKSSSKAVKP